MNRPPRHYRRYTAEDLATIDAMLGRASFEAIGHAVGRSAGAIEQYINKERRECVSARLDAEGLSIPQLAVQLGADKNAIWRWIRSRQLAHEWRIKRKHRVVVVTQAAVRAFILTGGLVDSGAAPREPWRTLAAQVEARWRLEYINSFELADALGYDWGMISTWLRTDHGLPLPAVPRVSNRPHYYSRAAVRAWLITHPQFAGPRARAALGIDEKRGEQ